MHAFEANPNFAFTDSIEACNVQCAIPVNFSFFFLRKGLFTPFTLFSPQIQVLFTFSTFSFVLLLCCHFPFVALKNSEVETLKRIIEKLEMQKKIEKVITNASTSPGRRGRWWR